MIALSEDQKETVYGMVYDYWKEHQSTYPQIAQVFNLHKSTIGKQINKRIQQEHGKADHIQTSVRQEEHHKDTKHGIMLYLAALLNTPNRGEAMDEEIQRCTHWVARNWKFIDIILSEQQKHREEI